MRYSTVYEIKALDVRSASLEDLVLAHVTLGQVVSGYKDLGVEVPDGLTGLAKDIKREVDERVRSDKDRKLKTMKARRSALATPDEKRARLDEEIAALEKELA